MFAEPSGNNILSTPPIDAKTPLKSPTCCCPETSIFVIPNLPLYT